MSDAEIPVRFELSINGNHIATGGVRHGVTTVHVTRVARKPGSRPSWAKNDRNWYREEIEVSLSGSDSREHIYWVKPQPLQIGDEVHLRLLGPGTVDEPVMRQHEDDMVRKKHKPVSNDGTLETELQGLQMEMHKAQMDVLAHLNASDDVFDRSRSQYEYVIGRMLGALNGAASKAKDGHASTFLTRELQVRASMEMFLGLVLSYRANRGLLDANG